VVDLLAAFMILIALTATATIAHRLRKRSKPVKPRQLALHFELPPLEPGPRIRPGRHLVERPKS